LSYGRLPYVSPAKKHRQISGKAQKVYARQDNKSFEVWRNLEAIHKVTCHTTIITWIWTLFKCTAEEGNNIKEHLNNLKIIWEQINLLSTKDFIILNLFFKIIISSSLLPSWDAYTQAYIAKTRCYATKDPFRNMGSQEFIGFIVAKAEHCLSLHRGMNLVYSAKAKNNKGKGLLFQCIMTKFKDSKMNDNSKES
jgi:hypothetical protein